MGRLKWGLYKKKSVGILKIEKRKIMSGLDCNSGEDYEADKMTTRVEFRRRIRLWGKIEMKIEMV